MFADGLEEFDSARRIRSILSLFRVYESIYVMWGGKARLRYVGRRPRHGGHLKIRSRRLRFGLIYHLLGLMRCGV
jgi:hypothetical protein